MPCLSKFVGRSQCSDNENGEALVNYHSLFPNLSVIFAAECENCPFKVCRTDS